MKLTAESTVFNDEKVQSKFSELIVDADGIRTEVSKKVGNDEVISRINQSAEAVSISANKINISGVITAINNEGSTVIDGGKIDADTLHVKAANIDGNLSIGKITDLQTSLDGAAKTATSYITDIDSQDGIIVKAVNGRTDGSDDTKKNYIKLNAFGLDIYQGGNSVAKYGADSRIGKENAQRIEIKNNTISMYENATDIAFQITSTGQINFGHEDGGVYIYERGLRSELMYNNNLWYSGYQSIAGTNPGIGSIAFWAGSHQKSYIGFNAEFAVGHSGLMKVNDIYQRPGRRTWVEDGNLPTSGQPYTCAPFGLGSYVALGYLTNSAGSLRFSIPLGRTLPYDTEIESITFNMVVRAGNANGVAANPV